MEKETSWIIIFLLLVSVAVLIILQGKYITNHEKQIKITYQDTIDVDTNISCFGPVYKIKVEDEEEIVRVHNIKINKEMDIISKFIKKRNNRVPSLVADQMAHSIVVRCEEGNIPTELVIGIIEVESLYDPYAIGPPVGGNHLRRARGLGQILDNTCGGLKVSKDKLHNINYNIHCIVDKMNEKLKATGGDVWKSLYCYVGKDDKYASKVFKVAGEFRYFRTQNM